MPHNRVRSGPHQRVIVIETGVHPELPAEMPDRGPGECGSNGAADGRGCYPPSAGRIASEDEGYEDREAFQQETDASGRGYGDRCPFLLVGGAKDEGIGPEGPPQEQLDPRK